MEVGGKLTRMFRVRLALPLLYGVLPALLVGCATASAPRPVTVVNHFRPLQTPSGPDVIELQVALIQRPLYDRFLSQDLWTEVDEQAVPLQRKVVLEENGFRVGQVGGVVPTGLQKLLTSENANINPRRVYVHVAHPAALPVGPAMQTCNFELAKDGNPLPILLDQAECLLSVEPFPTTDGRIRLVFTPQIRHGEAQPVPHAAEDQSGFILQAERPIKAFATLSWELTVAPNEYVLVGGRLDRPRSLGHHSFLRGDEPAPVQRLLAVRASRTAAPPRDELCDAGDEPVPPKRPVPLVLQAAWSSPP
jgi:hypothetical protein